MIPTLFLFLFGFQDGQQVKPPIRVVTDIRDLINGPKCDPYCIVKPPPVKHKLHPKPQPTVTHHHHNAETHAIYRYAPTGQCKGQEDCAITVGDPLFNSLPGTLREPDPVSPYRYGGSVVPPDGAGEGQHEGRVWSCRSLDTGCPSDPATLTITIVPVTREIKSCQPGWKLQRWHYGTDDLPKWNYPVARSDPSGYQDVPPETPVHEEHPDRCVLIDGSPKK